MPTHHLSSRLHAHGIHGRKGIRHTCGGHRFLHGRELSLGLSAPDANIRARRGSVNAEWYAGLRQERTTASAGVAATVATFAHHQFSASPDLPSPRPQSARIDYTHRSRTSS